MRRSLPFLIIAAAFVLAIGGGLLWYRQRSEPEPGPPISPVPVPAATAPSQPATPSLPNVALSPSGSTPSVSSTPTGPAFSYGRPGAEPMHLRGDPGAPVVLEEFGDFECLPCSILWSVLEKIEPEYAKRLVVVFREHPLKMHRFARDAARAAEAAGLQGRFWEMHDMLYRNRDTWVPGPYIGPFLNDYAAQLHLDVDRFKADMDGDEVTKRLAADWDRGESLGIDRTPVLFLNGAKVAVNARDEKALREAIDKLLGATPQPTP